MKTALVLLFVVSCVHAHGVMSKPLTRNDYLGYDAPTKNYNEGNPVGVSSTKFICQDQPDSDPKNYLSVTAGQTLSTLWANGHPGDCFMYITYDGDKPNAEKKWFKIKEWANCGDLASKEQTFVIPSYLPSSSHAILRWEMYALHLRSAGTVEFYAACTDIRVTAAANPNPTLPTPQVNIPGHLPTDASSYRNYGQTFLTGPPVASIGGSAYTATYTASPSQGGQTSQQTSQQATQQPTQQQTSQQQTSQQQTSQRPSQQITQQTSQQASASAPSTDCISQCKQVCGDAEIVECSCNNNLNVKCGSSAVSSASSVILSMVPFALYALF